MFTNNENTPYIISNRKNAFLNGIRDGFPIGLGYFAVSFSLGICAKNNGITPFQALITSVLCNSSSGEYAGFSLISAQATFLEVIIMIIIVNARYILMSFALSQRLPEGFPLRHRLILAFDITDELFAITIARPGFLNPYYTYGGIFISLPLWAAGTTIGAIAGNLMSARLTSAFSVALYGMFLAVFIPPAKRDKNVAIAVITCFICSYAATTLPGLSQISEGTRIIVLTILISSAAALLFPVNNTKGESENDS